MCQCLAAKIFQSLDQAITMQLSLLGEFMINVLEFLIPIRNFGLQRPFHFLLLLAQIGQQRLPVLAPYFRSWNIRGWQDFAEETLPVEIYKEVHIFDLLEIFKHPIFWITTQKFPDNFLSFAFCVPAGKFQLVPVDLLVNLSGIISIVAKRQLIANNLIKNNPKRPNVHLE